MADRTRHSRTPAKPAPPPSRWRLDLTAGFLLLCGMALALALFSHDPADAPGTTVYPHNPSPSNLLGSGGAWIAHELFNSLGLGAHTFLAAWFVMVLLLFLRRSVAAWTLRLLGWLMLVPVTAVLAARLGRALGEDYPLWTPSAGAGGAIGAWLNFKLEAMLVPAGQVLLLLAAVFLCLVLIADGLLVRLARALWGLLPSPRRVPSENVKAGKTAKKDVPVSRVEVRKLEDDEDEEEEEEERDEEEDDEEATPAGDAEPRSIPIRHHDHIEPGAVPPREKYKAPTEDYSDFELPPISLLDEPESLPHDDHDQKLRERATLLERTFADFGLNVQVVGINTGPVITQYEIALETGLRVYKVTRLAEDIALNLRVPSVRMVAPIPGKNTVGVEVPNEERARVRLKEVMLAAGKKAAQFRIPLFLGKDAEGRPLLQELADMPHLLIAGRTGTGKSVCMNAIILSILMTRRPDEVKMIMIDPKQTELSDYGKIPHLMHPVVTDMKKAEAILAWAVDKMEERYDLLRRARVRGIAAYNDLSHDEILRRVKPADDEDRANVPARMPYIVIFVDEMADLILMMKKEVEGHIIRLAQKARAAGIHLVVATQKPTVDVITGLIKSNLPARICFKVASKSDSRVVLDEMGADKLLGKGDMLLMPSGTSTLVRAQCTYASDQEIARVVEQLETEEPCYAEELMQLNSVTKAADLVKALRERDELYEAAIEVVIREQRGSVSLLQRALGIGYGRAARLVDYMAEDGIVGSYNGSNAREVMYSPEQWEQMKASSATAR